MTTKQRAIAEREELLLNKAAGILLNEGLGSLNMERLAEELETAKGTIYNHFPHREEVLLALSVKAVQKRQTMFDAASVFRGSSKQRMLAIGIASEIYFVNYPAFFLAESIVRNAAIWERCSQQRRSILREQEARCMGLVSGVVRSAIGEGSLKLPATMTAEELTLSFWALHYGTFMIHNTSPSLEAIGVQSTFRSVRLGGYRLLEGYDWLPNWTVSEFNEQFNSITRAAFPDERRLPELAAIS